MNRTADFPTTDDVDLGALWRAVVRKKGLLAGLVISASLATFIALQFVTPLYTSQARVLIENDETAFLRPRNEQSNTDVRVLLDPEAVASQVQVLLSRDLAYKVVKALKLDENPEFNTKWGPASTLKKLAVAIGLADAPSAATREEYALDTFEQRLSVYQIAKSRVIAVEFDSADPKLAAAAANTLAEKYLAWQQKTKLSQTRDASHWLSQQIDSLRKRVTESEAAVEKFRARTGLIAGSNDVTLDAQQLSELNSQLILARAQRSEAEARAELIRQMLKEKGDVASAPDVLRSALIQRLLEQRVRVRRQLAELSATLLPSHPRVRELNSELSDLQRQIRQEAKKIVSSLENEAQIAGAREASLRTSLDELKVQSSSSREDQVKLRSLEREAKANRELLESYLARHGEASARDESTVPTHASIIARAHVEREPSFPKKGPISALVGVAVGLLALASILGREIMGGTGTLDQPRSAVAGVREPYDAQTAPAVPGSSPASDATAFLINAKSARAVANVMRSVSTGPSAHNLIVTSGTASSNTAQDSVDIARAVAGQGLSAAIIDFSTSGAGVAGVLGLQEVPGLGELLNNVASFEDVIRVDGKSGVQVIVPGHLATEAFAGDGAEQWHRVHGALCQIYDCLVLHTSASAGLRLSSALQGHGTTLLISGGKKIDEALASQLSAQFAQALGAPVGVISYQGAVLPKTRSAGAIFSGEPAAAV